MRKVLLSGLLTLTALSASAAIESVAIQKASVEETRLTKSSDIRGLRHLPADVLMTRQDGQSRLSRGLPLSSRPVSRFSAQARADEKDGYVYYENFSGWDGTTVGWTPEGWTIEHRGEGTMDDSWKPFGLNYYYPAPVDGKYYFGINYGSVSQDEWFISPLVEVGENMELTWWMYLNPIFMYEKENIDWDKFEYTSDKVQVYTLQILARAEGEEDWTTLRDYAEDYKDLTLAELYEHVPYALEKHSVSLAAFAGKKTQVAFRYIGLDGESVFIDAIGIGHPDLEDVAYFNPFNTLYWGFSNNIDMTYITQDVAMYPVYAPLTWTNMSGEDATYSWEYCDPTTGDLVTSDDQYELTVAYQPNSSAISEKNNLFTPPTLKAEAPSMRPGSYTAPYSYFQAGGKFEVTAVEGELTGCLLPFAPNAQGVTRISVMDDNLGAIAVPVFGHDMFTDKYWLNYSLNGQPELEGDYSHLIGIANLFYASTEAPLVVNGLSVYGWGHMDADVQLTGTVYALNSEWSTDYSTFTVVGRATATGKDIEYLSPDGSKDFLYIPFRFEAPVVVQASEEHPAFVFMLEGFNSDKVEYFAPLQSKTGTPNDLTVGYILNEINLSAHFDEGYDPAPRMSFKPMVYKVGDEYIDPVGGFAIGVDAEYPWLTCEAEKIELTGDAESVTVALGSYYDGSRLTVEAPAGLKATVAGRYDDCVLTVTREAAMTSAVDGTVVVKGPGVEVSVPVSAAVAALDVIGIDEARMLDVYDLSGRKAVQPEAGVYVVKYTDGSVRKVVVR